jgi:competence protein ComGC
MQVATLNNLVANANKTQADADKANAQAVATTVKAQHDKYELEHKAMSDGMKAANL